MRAGWWLHRRPADGSGVRRHALRRGPDLLSGNTCLNPEYVLHCGNGTICSKGAACEERVGCVFVARSARAAGEFPLMVDAVGRGHGPPLEDCRPNEARQEAFPKERPDTPRIAGR